jgi:peptide/nickel transport system permease protein
MDRKRNRPAGVYRFDAPARALHGVLTAWLTLVVSAALLADIAPLPPPDAMQLAQRNALPSLAHPLGTDGFGRDMLSRIVHGARVSVLVGLLCPATGLLLGGTAGIAAGYLRGRTDRVITTLADVLLALPSLVIAMLFAAWLGGSLGTVLLTLGLLSTPAFMRVARARTLAVARHEYIEAARALGMGSIAIIWHHVLPNVFASLRTLFLLVSAVAIVLEGALAFLGLGVAAPTASWGGMIAQGRTALETHPHASLLPATALVLTVLALNVLGERLGKGEGAPR